MIQRKRETVLHLWINMTRGKCLKMILYELLQVCLPVSEAEMFQVLCSQVNWCYTASGWIWACCRSHWWGRWRLGRNPRAQKETRWHTAGEESRSSDITTSTRCVYDICIRADVCARLKKHIIYCLRYHLTEGAACLCLKNTCVWYCCTRLQSFVSSASNSIAGGAALVG